jgi:hypothetical protein
LLGDVLLIAALLFALWLPYRSNAIMRLRRRSTRHRAMSDTSSSGPCKLRNRVGTAPGKDAALVEPERLAEIVMARSGPPETAEKELSV